MKIVTESLLSYNIPQGMVRGATLELLDISYDGVEDPSNGYLTGGLGQLVDGKYGAENYRAMGENGVVRGEQMKSFYFFHLTDFYFKFQTVESLKEKFELLIINPLLLHFQVTSGSAGKTKAWGRSRWILHSSTSGSLTPCLFTSTIITPKIFKYSQEPRDIFQSRKQISYKFLCYILKTVFSVNLFAGKKTNNAFDGFT